MQRQIHGVGFVSAIIITILVGSVVIAGVGVASADVSYISISQVSVSEDEPVAGNPVTITPTILHSSAGNGGFQVTEAVLVTSDGTRLVEVNNLGTIGAGDSLKVPLRTSFEEAGEKHLTVRVRGNVVNSSGTVKSVESVEYPVYVDVSAPSDPTPEAEPQVSVNADTMVSGTSTPVRVTVSNSRDSEISDVAVHLSSAGDQIETQTKLQPILSARNMSTFVFDVTPTSPGELDLNATVEYDSGSTQVTRTVDVVPVQDDIFIDAVMTTNNGTNVIQYQVTNAGNAPIHNVLISGEGSNADLTRASFDTINASSTATTTVPTGTSASSLALNVSYTVGSQNQYITQTVQGDALDASSTGVESKSSTGLGGILNGMSLTSIGLLFGGLAAGGAVGHRHRLRSLLRKR
ncbi:hypothetical protein GCM10009037_29380 [Halarchaeum grantii]|uniref:CARDB domain-containing protein n=2 Tax=Halarchaeum grantii TaxID=1193105 RepID=A0A830F0V2_9EURY|nr:hypothetical protein GCM10009037_29380 [Halarchaeum grantii]